MAAIVLSQIATNLLAPGIYGVLAAGAEISSASALWSISQGLAGFAGSMVGSVIDRALFGPGAQHLSGPRLSDLAVQSSADGAPLPVVFGTSRIAGNVIWSTGLKEQSHKQKQGGGSGGGGGSYTTYTYSTDAAIALCEGEIIGIRRIWADTKLIYDVSDTADVATLVASNGKADGIRIYTGSESQQPDPLIQATVGVAAAPAYRGTAYVVFEGLQLADYGNRLPSLSFEVVTNGSIGGVITEYPTPVTEATYGYFTHATHYDSEGLHIIECNDTNWSHYVLTPGAAHAYLKEVRGISASGQLGYLGGVSADCDEPGAFMMGPSGMSWFYAGYAGGDFVQTYWILPESWSVKFGCKVGDDYLISGINGSGYLRAALNGNPLGSLPQNISCTSGTCCGITDNYLLVFNQQDKNIYRFDRGGNYIDSFASGVTSSIIRFVSDTTAFAQMGTGNNFALVDFSNTASPVITTLFSSSWLISPSPSNTLPALYDLGGNGYFGFLSNYQSVNRATVATTNTLSLASMPLASAVADILDRAGLTAGQYDSAALTADDLNGYVIARPMSARAALEPLSQAYFFDLVEQDGKIVAVKRGGAAVRTLAEDDLGASESAAGERVVLTRSQEMELPSEIQVSYQDQDNDYQAATQYARRLSAEHLNVFQVQLPIVLSSQAAARIADVALKAAWYARHTLALRVPFDHARLVPTDIITLQAAGEWVTARITTVEVGSPGIVALSAVPELPALYDSAAGAADSAGIGQTVAGQGATNAVLLDCALLQDSDAAFGWYCAAGGYVSGWKGGTVFATPDNGATWAPGVIVPSSMAATVGYATTQLGTADCRVWDEANTVKVRLLYGSISSATDLAVLNGANAFALGRAGMGWEICQFRTATLNGDGTYTLSGLLRGRKGTDWMAGSHQAGDVFLLLAAADIQWLSATAGDVGVAKKFKSVSNGQALEDVNAVSITYTGERSRCLSPVLLGGGRDGSGHIQFFWTRRTRIGGEWVDYNDAGLGETTEAYEAEVYTNNSYSTVKRTFTGLTTPLVVYSSAQQVSDFGSNQSVIYVRVYQMGATGRGRYLQGSI